MCALDNVTGCVQAEVKQICGTYDKHMPTGEYILCSDCRKYLEFKDGKVIATKSCPNYPGWGFNAHTRVCEYRSPHCIECEGWLRTL